VHGLSRSRACTRPAWRGSASRAKAQQVKDSTPMLTIDAGMCMCMWTHVCKQPMRPRLCATRSRRLHAHEPRPRAQALRVSVRAERSTSPTRQQWPRLVDSHWSVICSVLVIWSAPAELSLNRSCATSSDLCGCCLRRRSCRPWRRRASRRSCSSCATKSRASVCFPTPHVTPLLTLDAVGEP